MKLIVDLTGFICCDLTQLAGGVHSNLHGGVREFNSTGHLAGLLRDPRHWIF
jgi:hypothetical protein